MLKIQTIPINPPGRHQHRADQQYYERGPIVKLERQIVNGYVMRTEFHVRPNGRERAEHVAAVCDAQRLSGPRPATANARVRLCRCYDDCDYECDDNQPTYYVNTHTDTDTHTIKLLIT